MRFLLLSLFVGLCSCISSYAQTTFAFGSPTVCPGTGEVVVDVSVAGFTDVQGAQFTVSWDENALELDPSTTTQGVGNFGLNNLSQSNFSYGPNNTTSYLDDGYFTFSWFASSTAGETVADGTVIYSITLGVLSPGTTTIDAIGVPTSILTFVNNAVVPTSILAGTITTADGVDPTLACPANTVQFTAPAGSTSTPVTGLSSGAADNCVLASVTYLTAGQTSLSSPSSGINDISGETFNIGLTTVSYTATDLQGNSETCTFDVEVLDGNGGLSSRAEINVSDAVVDCAASTVLVPVTVEGFDNVRGYSGTIQFNPAELDYQPGQPISGFNAATPTVNIDDSNEANGRIAFSAFSGSGTPFNIGDGEILFSIPLTYVSGTNPIVFINSSQAPLDVVAQRGGTPVSLPTTSSPGTVLFADNTDPAFSACPVDFSVNVDPGTCEATVTYTAPTATDDCDPTPSVSLVSGPASGTVLPEGPATVVYTATDASGNSATCSFTITVVDDIDPILSACPADVNLQTQAGACTAVATWTAPTATDNCATAPTIVASHQSGDAFSIGTTTVTYTATDGAGNTTTCSFDVTITDGADPVFDFCPPTQTVNVDAGACTYSGAVPVPTATDDCSTVTVTQTGGPTGNLPVGTSTLTYTATDASGNTALCTFDVVVSDNTDPQVAVCPAAIAVDAVAGTCAATVSWTSPSFTDACGTPTVTSTHNPGDAFPVGITIVTYTATDAANNSASCSFAVNVRDVEGPAFTDCPSTALTASAPTGDCGAVVTYPAPSAVDVCDGAVNAQLISGLASGSTFPVGTSTVLYRAEDAAGNSTECSFAVVVTDDERPTITCPANQTANTLPGDNASTVSNIGPSASDNCQVASVSYTVSGATTTSGMADASNLAFFIGVSTVTYTATDGAGNSASCSFTVTINGPVGAPDITCPADVQVDASAASCAANVPGIGVVITTPTADIASVTYTLSGATTGSGVGDASGTSFAVGSTLVTYTVTGINTEVATCSFSVTVRDVEGPSFVDCPTAPISMSATKGACGAAVTYSIPTATDLCDGAITAQLTSGLASGDVFPVGQSTVMYTATDAAGNSTQCSFDVVVTDDELPVVTCPADQQATATAGTTTVSLSGLDATATDNCQVASLDYSITGATTASGTGDASAASFAVGTSTVVYTATDAAGNSGTCSFSVVVSLPAGAPDISCPADLTIDAAAAACGATVSDISVTTTTPASDIASIRYALSGATSGGGSDDASGTRFALGTTQVTYTITGTNAEVATCTFEVTVRDVTPPTLLSCPSDQVVAAIPGQCRAVAFWMPPVFRDDCGPVTVTPDVTPGTLLNVGSTVVTYTATDASGNSAICAFTVTVEDRQQPGLRCPTDQTLTLAPGQTSVALSDLSLVTNDNCGVLSVTYTVSGATTASGRDDASGIVFEEGVSTLTYTVTDVNANTVSCSTIITVNGPATAPDFSCPSDATAVTAIGACNATVGGLSLSLTTPAADIASISYVLAGATTGMGTDDASNETFNIGVTTVTYTVIGTNGLQATCTVEVTVNTGNSIVATNCPADLTANADMNVCVAPAVMWTPPTFTSPCETPTVNSTHAPGDPFPVGTTTVTYTASTTSGLLAVCAFEVVVRDVVAPVLDNCPSDQIVMAAPGGCDAVAMWPTITATDACDGAVVVTTDVASGSTFPVGTTTVTATTTDAAGNDISCSFTVTVVAGSPVTFTCPASVTYRADGQRVSDPDNFITSGISGGCNDLLLDFSLPAATSGCGTAVVNQVSGLPSGARFPLGTTTVVFETMGSTGSPIQCSVDVTVLPELALELSVSDSMPCIGDNLSFTAAGPAGAQYQWTGPNSFTAAGPAASLNNVGANSTGVYRVSSVSAGGCVQLDSITVTVGEFPDVEITSADFVCGNGTDDIVLEAGTTNGVALASYSWTGPNGFTSALPTPIISNATTLQSGTYAVTVTSVNGCIGSASKFIRVAMQPDAPDVLVSNLTPCTNEEVIFTGSGYTAPSVVYNWTVSPSAGARLDPVNFVAVFQATQPGAYEVCYTVDVNGCSTQTVCNTINVEIPPRIVLSGRDSIACTDGSRALSLSETNTANATYRWTGPTGAVLSDEAQLSVANVTSANAGVYTLRVTSQNGCVSDTSVNVRITDRPATPSLQSDRAMLCLGEVASLQATDLGPSIDYRWTASQSGTAGIPAINNLPLLSVQPTEIGTYIYELRADLNGCLSDVVTATLEVMGTPEVSAAVTGDTDCVLGVTALALTGAADAGLDYTWSGPNGYTSTDLVATLNAAGSAANGTYTLTATNAASCQGETTVQVNITEGVAQLSTFSDGDQCRGETVQLFANEVPGASYQWTGPNGYASSAQNPTIQSLTPSFSGSFTAIATLANGCVSAPSEPIDLAILNTPEALADRAEFVLGTNTISIDLVENDDLGTSEFSVAITRDPVYGTLIVDQEGGVAYSTVVEVPREDRFEYEVCLTECPELCARALVTVEIDYDREECIPMTVISPNGDGLNDEFYISCLEDPDMNPRNSLQIFNEWGDEVFSALPYLNDWQGTYEGADLPDGTYYYIFKPGPNQTEKRGSLTIYR